MGQHKHNPTAIAAAAGLIKSKPKPEIKVWTWDEIKAAVMPRKPTSKVNRRGK